MAHIIVRFIGDWRKRVAMCNCGFAQVKEVTRFVTGEKQILVLLPHD